jgi:putative PIN family toxin of toxin-antitoxin system
MQHELVVSDFILDEVTRKLRTKFAVPAVAVRRVRSLLVAASEQVVPAEVSPDACRDAADLPVLGTALAGRAQLLVTVDRDLLDAGPFHGILIARPGRFWELTRG